MQTDGNEADCFADFEKLFAVYESLEILVSLLSQRCCQITVTKPFMRCISVISDSDPSRSRYDKMVNGNKTWF